MQLLMIRWFLAAHLLLDTKHRERAGKHGLLFVKYTRVNAGHRTLTLKHKQVNI
jgi:hypothetical protein